MVQKAEAHDLHIRASCSILSSSSQECKIVPKHCQMWHLPNTNKTTNLVVCPMYSLLLNYFPLGSLSALHLRAFFVCFYFGGIPSSAWGSTSVLEGHPWGVLGGICSARDCSQASHMQSIHSAFWALYSQSLRAFSLHKIALYWTKRYENMGT